MEELIAKRYAKAFSSAKKDLKESLKLLNILSEAICDDKIQKVLASPVVPNQQKTQLLLSVLHDTSDTMLINFIKILGENKRLELIPVITKVLNADEQKASNVYQGTLKSKEALDEKALHSLETTLKKYTGSNIKLIQQKSELDGMRVSVDDLGIEVNFSKQRVKEQLIDFIKKSL
ncbi:MAG: F0F1 ATP synthase subunit delta [Sulfurovum sp.]|nr:F0F1 ATP synthase subunit delta [Sulfurovum sp.]MDD3602904.1 F0F1 ATP synthase subunit delta [Sulfurovum sp.]